MRSETIAVEAWRYRVAIGGQIVEGYNARDREHAERMLSESLVKIRQTYSGILARFPNTPPAEGWTEHRPAGAARFVKVTEGGAA